MAGIRRLRDQLPHHRHHLGQPPRGVRASWAGGPQRAVPQPAAADVGRGHPVATALLSEYLLAGNGNARSAALVYSAVMLAMSFGFAVLYSYVALHPVLLADGVDPGAVRGSIVRFSAVGIGIYVVTLGIAVASAPACLVAHFVIAIYYCFQQIRPGSPAA
jgi:hypothetical protein